jgi:oxygen-independent coproporphyrinogen-3 oxidase
VTHRGDAGVLVYIHVPFCGRRCSYCDFAVAIRRETPARRYTDTVLREWELRQQWTAWDAAPEVETVYFGGGTPSRLDPAALRRILDAVRARRPLVDGAEITLEANPEDVTAERAGAWRTVGVNRVSLGVQSFHPPTLVWMHRMHSAERSAEAVRTLRAAGFDNISLDLIYGLPRALGRDWEADLRAAIALEPDHISLYALTVERGTALGKWISRGVVAPEQDDRVADEYLLAHELLGAAGYQHYEVSNAGRPGRWARHNLGYWQRRPFVGLGPSAHSGAGRERAWNLREWEAYARAVEEGRDPREGCESLTEFQAWLEEMYLGLRTASGVPRSAVPEAVGEAWVRARWAETMGQRLRLTAEGWLRLDALVAALPTPPTFLR